MVAILASSEDNTIGAKNTIPWRCRTDMLFFKKATTGNVVIMGRNTFESMNCKPLPNRFNVVVSRTLNASDYTDENISVVSNLIQAITLARRVDLTPYSRNTVQEHIFVIGGVQLYTQAINVINEVIHSKIDIHCGSP